MSTPITLARPRAAHVRGTLQGWTIVALAGGALALTYLQVTSIGFDPFVTAFVVLALVFAALVARGLRWTPLLGPLWSLLVIAPYAPYLVYDLTHPALFDHFAFGVVLVALALLGTVAGIGATVLHERSRHRAAAAPRWFVAALGCLAGLSLGAILAAMPAASSAASGVSAAALAQLPALAALPTAFDRPELRVKLGETVALRLENLDSTAHSFDIDAFEVHTLMPVGASSLALFRPSAPGSYPFYCAIPGHREAGMHGTLIVAP